MCLICNRIAGIQSGTNPYFVQEPETGYVVLGDHQHFRGYTLFLCKRHETELFYLEPEFAARFLQEMVAVAAAVKAAFGAEKINYELLGNGDTHLHWHLFPRRSGDIGSYGNQGKGPVWWYPREKMYAEDSRPSAEALEALRSALERALNTVPENPRAHLDKTL